MSVPLPPLPEPGLVITRDSLRRQGDWYGPDQLRARDLEVVRCVLEAAETACGHLAQADAVAAIIRKLEFHHE